ncbi:MAG TPA: hypothetical protein VGB77_18175 [Abditibacteriaceae bacterium]|jgi:hypothetical protein
MQNLKWHDNPSLNATPSLPSETTIGLRHFQFKDLSREDISTGRREFMVSVFYRAETDVTAPRARLTDILQPRIEEALDLLSLGIGLTAHEKDTLFSRLVSLTLRAQRDLRPLHSRSPVLIFYPGGQGHRLANAALCEALACKGYVVFALDAPRDAPVVVFPDGRMVTPPAPDDESYIWPRVADVCHLLDELETLNSAGPFAGVLDLSRVGMFGHSRGGYLSNICAVEDERIGAACNMDGFLWGLWVPEGTGLDQYPLEFQQRARALETPLLRLRGDQGGVEAARRGFEEERLDFGGDFIYAALHGYTHGDFATIPWLCGAPEDLGKNAERPLADPARVELLSGLLVSFFDTYLLGERSGIPFLVALEEHIGMDVFSELQISRGE